MNQKFVYSGRESKNLEFKSKLPPFNVIIKTCVAFANGFGGKIIIGVEDKTGRIIGVSDKDRNRLYEDFHNSLYDSVAPALMARVWEKSFNDLSVLVIEILPGPKKPYFLKSYGIPKGVYIRVGSCTRRANDDYVEELVREGQRMPFDEELIGGSTDILSRELLQEYYDGKVLDKRLLSDKIIGIFPANSDRYLPTVAGVLFFSPTPHMYISEAVVLCTQFKGDKGREIIRTEELKAPLGQLADNAFNLVCSWLQQGYQLEKTRLKRKIPIPEEALREAIINALIHRKYSIPGAVKVAVYDNHCEVFSPGSFPGVVDVTNLGDGTTYLRNPVVARIARKMGLAEKLGSGIRLIFDSCQKAGLKKPEYYEDGDFVKVVFSFESIQRKDSSEIMDFIKQRGKLTNKDVMKLLNVSRNTATRKLNVLMKQGKLIRCGKGPSVYYCLNN